MGSLLSSPAAVAAILGITAGWILSTLSSGVRYRIEKRRDLGKGLAQLLPPYLRLESLMQSLELFKDGVESWKDFEGTRSHILDRNGDVFERTGNVDIQNTIDSISRYNPYLAVEFRSLTSSILEILRLRQPTVATMNEDAYIKLLALQETIFEESLKKYLELLKRLALTRGIVTRLKLWRFLRTRGRSTPTGRSNQQFLGEFFKEASGQLRASPSERAPAPPDRPRE